MLFIVNGLVKHRRWYNAVLGFTLIGLLVFNCDDAEWLHYSFAAVFFVGNVAVMLIYSSKKQRWFKGVMVSVIGLAMAGYFLIDWFSLFWAEWISLLIVALHYVLESWELLD